MSIHNIPSCERKSKIYVYYASRPRAMVDTHLLELSLSRTYFHSSKGVRVIEVLPYMYCLNDSYCIALKITRIYLIAWYFV